MLVDAVDEGEYEEEKEEVEEDEGWREKEEGRINGRGERRCDGASGCRE